MLFFALIIMIITGLLAYRKGYSFFIWMFAAGVIGLIVLACLPFANDPKVSAAENQRRAESGNSIGMIFVVLTILLVVARLFIHL